MHTLAALVTTAMLLILYPVAMLGTTLAMICFVVHDETKALIKALRETWVL